MAAGPVDSTGEMPFGTEQLVGERRGADDLELPSLVVQHRERRGRGADRPEGLVEERRRDLGGRERSRERSRQRLEPAHPPRRQLRLEPRLMLALVESSALERLRCLAGDRLDQAARCVVGTMAGAKTDPSSPMGIALDEEGDDREDAVVVPGHAGATGTTPRRRRRAPCSRRQGSRARARVRRDECEQVAAPPSR